jgi:hypothetical protein
MHPDPRIGGIGFGRFAEIKASPVKVFGPQITQSLQIGLFFFRIVAGIPFRQSLQQLAAHLIEPLRRHGERHRLPVDRPRRVPAREQAMFIMQWPAWRLRTRPLQPRNEPEGAGLLRRRHPRRLRAQLHLL